MASSQKLRGQEGLARNNLRNPNIADVIARKRDEVSAVDTIQAIRQVEAQAAHAYWSAWRTVPVEYPKIDIRRVPEHWRTFGTRQSPLTGSPRLAVNPPNSILNYLYAVLESETRLAIAAPGLDPGLGVMHVDAPSRDSLAFDLMEPVRPLVDTYLLEWISREPLRREWFFEQRDGNCRLMTALASRLSETSDMWRRAIAPMAEWVSRTLWARSSKSSRQIFPATRLTQCRRREAKGVSGTATEEKAVEVPRLCRTCGNPLKRGKRVCASCAKAVSRANLTEAAKRGRIATHSARAEALRAATQRRHAKELTNWKPSDNPAWLTAESYRKKVQPLLSLVAVPAISSMLRVSGPYATEIRRSRRVPHPRHWLKLAQLVGVTQDN